MKENVAYIFPGQGSHYVGMGKDFFDNFSAVKEVFQEAGDILHKDFGKIAFYGSEKELTETINSQVAIYIVSVSICNVMKQEFGILPKVFAGLSLGEYSALTASGILPFDQGIVLVSKRAELMQEACNRNKGGMVAVLGANVNDALEILRNVNMKDDLWIANYNYPGQVVFSGTERGIDRCIVVAKESKLKTIKLNVSGAFHSGLMKDASKSFRKFVEATRIVDVENKNVVLNTTSCFPNAIEDIKNEMIEQIYNPVLWQQSIERINSMNVDYCIELGPKSVLTKMNSKMNASFASLNIDNVKDMEKFSSIRNS